MKFASVCSGIEAPALGWMPLGWEPQFFSEIASFPSAVLLHRHPTVPNLGDMLNFKRWPHATIDVLIGGTPCQSFSVAGLRAGLDDPRGNLALVYLAIAERHRPRWVVWENVPGVLSSKGGRDFGSFLGGLAQLGYGFAYRVLDAQFFGVPQRRRRVFVVGCLDGWQRAAAVLFESACLRWDHPPRSSQGEAPAGTVTASSRKRGWPEPENIAHTLRGPGFDASEDGTGRGIPLIANTLTASGGARGGARLDPGSDTLLPFDPLQICSGSNRSNPQPGDPAPTMSACGPAAIAFNVRGREVGAVPESDPDNLASLRASSGGSSRSFVAFDCKVSGSREFSVGELSPTLRAMSSTGEHANGGGQVAVAGSGYVRRLMPIECERLQGMPDDWTLVPFGRRGKPAKDGPRYEAIGNSMAVPVLRWLGERIAMVEALDL